MFDKVLSFGLYGFNTFLIDVEANIVQGMPAFNIVGLPDIAVKESRERIRSALRACGIRFPVSTVTVNLAPADTKKSGSVLDTSIFMALLKAMGLISRNTGDCIFIGELSLSGSLRGITGVLPMIIHARELGIKSAFVPAANAREASVITGINIYAVDNAEQLINHFRGEELLTPCEPYIPPEAVYDEVLDFADVKGQQFAKRALEIAAAGGHNALLSGSPGSGKSMLSKRMPSILPPLTFEEALETTKVHSIAGMLTPEQPIITKRPFRAPHHTISSAGLSGGGTVPRPGEVSLAHNGLLFLDEIAEFDKRTLENLRQPIEEHSIQLSRVSGSATYPCSFMLIGAMNPCPCGYYGHPTRQCTCSPKRVAAYNSRISGPLLDRFDLYIEVAPLEFCDLSSEKKEESSESVRRRVIAARKIQAERFKGTGISCNAMITDGRLDKYCHMDEDVKKTFNKLYTALQLSGRAYSRLLKVARTIADLSGSENIRVQDIKEAAQYRKK